MNRSKLYRVIGMLLALALALAACAPPPGWNGTGIATTTAATTPPTTTTKATATTTTTAATTAGVTVTQQGALSPTDDTPSEFQKLVWAAMPDVPRDGAGHALMAYKDIKYVRPDLDAVFARLDQATELVNGGGDAAAVFKLYDQLRVDYEQASTALSIISIQSDLNVNDTKISAEKVDLSGKINDLYDKMCTLTQLILNSSLGDAARERWGEKYTANSQWAG
jgi:hypothetical protein